jgi:hypothetical protein
MVEISKRGAMQLDWVISLALFLMFLAFTFLLISPKTEVFIDEKSALNNIKYNFIDDYSFEVSYLPVFIKTQRRGVEPVIFQNDYYFSNFLIEDKTIYSYVDGEIIFLSNITDDYTIKKIVSNQYEAKIDYNSNKMMLYYEKNSSFVPSRMVEVKYTDDEIDYVVFEDKIKFNNFSLAKNSGEKIDFPNKNFTNSTVANVYYSSNNFLLFKQYLIYDLPRVIFNFNSSSEFEFSFYSFSYDSFYYPVQFGDLHVNETWCLNITTDYLDLSNGKDTVTFKMDPTSFSICTENKGYAIIKFFSPKKIELFFTNLNLSENYNYTKEFVVYSGIPSKKNGVSSKRLENISKKTPDELREEYGISNTIDFELFMTDLNYTSLFLYSYHSAPKEKNVFIKRWNDYLIDEYGTKKNVIMGVKVWQ